MCVAVVEVVTAAAVLFGVSPPLDVPPFDVCAGVNFLYEVLLAIKRTVPMQGKRVG